MKFLLFAVLAIVAAFVVIGWIIGLAFELLGLGIMAFLVVAGVGWVMRRLGKPTDIDRNRLTR